MKASHRLGIAGLLLIIFSSCKHEPILPDGSNDDYNNGREICFEAQVLPIFQNSCALAGCHNSVAAIEGYVFDSYSNIVSKGIKAGNANDSKVYEVLLKDGDDRMPPLPLSELSKDQIGIIRQWINEGAKNTVGCASCDTNSFTYSSAVVPIINAYCVTCHNTGSPSGGINFDNYASVKLQVTSGALIGSIKHLAGFSAMPQGSPKLDDCLIRKVEKWIENGSPNN